MSTNDTPAPAYRGVEQENDPGEGTAIAEQAPAARSTLSSAADEFEPSPDGPSTTGAPEVPGNDVGDVGLPSGSTDTPAADTGVRRDGADPGSPQRPGGSGNAGGDPGEWPESGRAGVSGRAAGPADLENPGGTGLTTTDTEGGDR